MSDRNKNTIQSIDRAIRVLKCFDYKNELGVTEISKILDLHKSTTFGLISTLEYNGFLKKNEVTGKYRLGLELYRLGTKVNFSLRETVVPYLEKLVEMYEETANLVVMQNTFIVYLEKVESTHSMRISTLIGGRKPAYCTSVGKVIMAHLPTNDLYILLPQIDFKRHTDNTITDKQTLKESLEIIKKNGYAEDRGELEIGLHCIAAPLLNQHKYPFAAISVSGPSTRMDKHLCKDISNTLVQFAQEISRELGCV